MQNCYVTYLSDTTTRQTTAIDHDNQLVTPLKKKSKEVKLLYHTNREYRLTVFNSLYDQMSGQSNDEVVPKPLDFQVLHGES